MMLKNTGIRILALLGLLLVGSWFGCSDRGVNNDDAAVAVNMTLKVASPGMVDAISQFRVTVTASDIDPPIDSPLALVGRYLEGVILVPPGNDRVFTVEARDIEGEILYSGDTTVAVVSAEPVVLTINLYPMVSLVRVSPRYLEVPANSDFAVDVRAFNVRELYGLTFHLHWNGTVIYPDSARSLLPVGAAVLFFDRIDPTLRYYDITISNSDQLTPIVDTNGDADLVRVFFSAFSPEPAAYLASLSMEVMEMTRLPQDTIPLDSVKADGSTIVVLFPAL